jgi:hypothetical protein
MCVFRAAEDTELGQLAAPELGLGQHAFDRLHQDPVTLAVGQQFLGRNALDAARITGVMVIDLVGLLVAGHGDFFGVDDNDAIAAIHMGREGGLVLAAKDLGANGRQSAQDEVLGIDDEPFHLNIRRFGGNGFHIKQSRKVYRSKKRQRPQEGSSEAEYDRF